MGGPADHQPVLVVEDEPSIRELLREAFEQDGLRVLTAADGEEAIRIAKAHRPGLVLLDMGLPVLDGASVADAIRDAYGDTIPFVVVTASNRIEEAAARLRAARYFAKPFDIPELVRAVRAALEPPAAAAERAEPSTSPAT